MEYRRFGRLGWQVSEVGYGMWGIAGGEGGWTGADDATGQEALDKSVELGCTFFDTAWIYGRGHSEELLGDLLRRHEEKRLYVATKIPPKDRNFPSRRDSRLQDVFPEDHILEYTKNSLEGLGTDSIDLLQFHVWEDAWADDAAWQEPIRRLRDEGVVKGVGISVNRWEPTNVLKALDTGLIDSVQVIYNIFDQAPEDELFTACQERDIAVIARVPFDEGSLTGTLTRGTTWPQDDWRASYFVPENLEASVEHADRLKTVVPDGMTMPELALRFILQHPAVSTVIPGMRSVRHVASNLGVSGREPLSPELYAELRRHRWDRTPTAWSQ
ncbi:MULTISPECIES: aldo/keto reductase [Streptomyces]|uniref:Aldo/keto reductase n=1 Tax=Streptomyces venezuelae TaxID=54571 RepID=A0A5P2BGY4_STRVZ|nr:MULTISPECIES: aldo/keto reductase [Streptomyces]NEA05604.1 aldo/keto reductase [Streptomyces sp. SID10116]MYY84757.1 aldo/keto reductase [Streptomyces sp. SID335]MYZ17013.1 aldo/keto reductase [Streptomyces sp. SID337]NDZ84940.1 aldo/keto reductase [Streptomyces sp. SID10115]NEB45311.1 aldo/keto reductase [Streptomyces sp. SID339]